MDADVLAQAKEGAYIANVLPYIKEALDKRENLLVGRVIQDLRDFKLTPEAALYAWQELKTLRELYKSFETRVKLGRSAGETATKE